MKKFFRIPVGDSARSSLHRLSFTAPALLAAGSVALAALGGAEQVQALSGTVTAASVTTTPRESSGASGGATLIKTAASTSESTSTSTNTAAAASQVSGTSSEEGSTTGSTSSGGATKRHAQVAEGRTTTKHRGKTTTTGTSVAAGGKNVVSGKESKAYVAPPVAPTGPTFTLSSGFETRYIYNGLDVISFDSKLGAFNPFVSFLTGGKGGEPASASSSAIYYTNADMTFMGAHLGIGYVRAVSPTYPFLQTPIGKYFFTQGGVPVSGNFTAPEFAVKGPDASTSNHRRFYQEVDVPLDYTVNIVGNLLQGTAGYDSYFFAYRDFRGASYQGNIHGRLAYTQFSFAVPSFTIYHYVAKTNDSALANLNGSLVEFRIDGSLPLINKPGFGVTVQPYISATYNIDYLQYKYNLPTHVDAATGAADAYFRSAQEANGVGGWNDLEVGVKVPVRIGKSLSITPYGNYGLNLSDSDTLPINNFTGRAYGEKTTFWGGVTVAYSF